jgi:hypothetical protein
MNKYDVVPEAIRFAARYRIKWELERLEPEAKLWRQAGDIPRAIKLERRIAELIAQRMAL